MELSSELKSAIDNELKRVSHDELLKNSEKLSTRYRNESGQGKHLLTYDSEAITYSVVRMPATYGAVYKSLKYSLEFLENLKLNSLLDVGAGTGAASFAVDSLIDLESVTCLEREDAMINLGSRLMQSSSGALKAAKWIKYDLARDDYNGISDMVCSSYVLNELSEEDRIKAIDKLWSYTDKVLLIIEPGTPVGSANIMKAREQLIKNGARIIAPCLGNNKCSLPHEQWCHFSCRVERSKLHKILKKADVPYEDEKFSYIAVVKEDLNISNTENMQGRVLRHPVIKKGRVQAEICTKDGIQKKEFYKKDGDIFKKVKKSDWGDII